MVLSDEVNKKGYQMTYRVWPRSGSGKFIVACVLIPFLWPYVPFILLFMAAETLRITYISRKYRKVKLRKSTHG